MFGREWEEAVLSKYLALEFSAKSIYRKTKIVFTESRLISYLHLQSPQNLTIESDKLVFTDTHISFLVLTKIDVEDVWFLPSWFGGEKVTLKYVTSDGKSHALAFLTSGDQALGISKKIKSQLHKFLEGLLQQLEKSIDAIDVKKNAVYVPLRFVRHSHAKKFSEAESPNFQKLQSYIQKLSTHALLTLPLKARATVLLQKTSTLASYILFFEEARTRHNYEYKAHFRIAEASYFQSVESSRLTDEQIETALVFDDANLVVAAAGSGKSSCIVGKIGFALKTELYKDGEVLALAYNKKAAKELKERLNTKLSVALNRKVSIESKTFHSFGLSLLSKHHNKDTMPQVFTEEGKEENRFINTVITDLLQGNASFKLALANWLLISPHDDPEPLGVSGDLEACAKRYEECCRERIHAKINLKRKPYEPSIPTYHKEVYVRSLEEMAIANWLLMRGIKPDYERVCWGGADRLKLGLNSNEKKRAYNPDFTYFLTEKLSDGKERNVRVVHEHFGINRYGNAPSWMGGDEYVKQANQKRTIFNVWTKEDYPHKERVIFFETTSAQMRDGSIWGHLEKSLKASGVVLGEPDASIQEAALNSFRESNTLETLIVDFVLKYKDSGLTSNQVRLEAAKSINPYRASLFLDVALKVFDAYQTALKDAGRIDFADMIRNGVSLLKERQVVTPYRLILVDEFQDISRLKADLVKAVLDQFPETSILFCVGDDWQTINRFAGSDVGIFTNVASYFNRHTETLKLTRTFRCAQGIADVSRALVMRNAGQIDKEVMAQKAKLSKCIRVLHHGLSDVDRQTALVTELERITTTTKAIGLLKPKVLLLRRTQNEFSVPGGLKTEYLEELTKQYTGRLDLHILSLHGSKGLEADFVILLGLDSGKAGFPDERPEEPLFNLVLPKLSNLVEEERRLFYVGLTRAKHQAIVLACGLKPSEFVLELDSLQNKHDSIEWIAHTEERTPCPKCKRGSLIFPTTYAKLKACSRISACGYSERYIQ